MEDMYKYEGLIGSDKAMANKELEEDIHDSSWAFLFFPFDLWTLQLSVTCNGGREHFT